MRVQGIYGDSLTYQTMLNGCLQFSKFEKVLELLRDAKEARIQLPQELTQNILNELNKWRTPEDNQLKQDVTQKVLAYLDLFNNKQGQSNGFYSSGFGFRNNNGGLSGDSQPYYHNGRKGGKQFNSNND